MGFYGGKVGLTTVMVMVMGTGGSVMAGSVLGGEV